LGRWPGGEAAINESEFPVVVVGGRVVGMTAAMLLGLHGVPALVVERHPGAAIHPRAALLLQRSMEILRLAATEDGVRRKSSSPASNTTPTA
jgi:2-polyprenyl-6-methoxyphenol hydroxylase-like FAD-dependent oxidoreductase